MHKDDLLHLGNKLQRAVAAQTLRFYIASGTRYRKSIGEVKSQNSVHTPQFVENNKYYIFDILNSKRFGWHISRLSNIVEKHQQPEKILRA